MSNEKYSKEICIGLLKDKQTSLSAEGETRYPERRDFSDEEVIAVKAFLGPWPRALEAASLKPARNGDRAALNKEKRIRAKRKRTEIRKSLEKSKKATESNE